MKTFNTTSFPILGESGFTVVSVSPETISKVELGIIRAYKDVFNASAWREGVKCSSGCGYKTIFEEAPKSCPDCGGKIEDFYSEEEISSALRSVMDKSYYQMLILMRGSDVAGFTWGWRDSLISINQDKLRIQDEKRLIIGLKAIDIEETNTFYYQSETGIVPKYRSRGIGAGLVGVNEQELQNNKDSVVSNIQRTSRLSPMYRIRENLGYNEVFSYNDTDQRVIFAKNNS